MGIIYNANLITYVYRSREGQHGKLSGFQMFLISPVGIYYICIYMVHKVQFSQVNRRNLTRIILDCLELLLLFDSKPKNEVWL